MKAALGLLLALGVSLPALAAPETSPAADTTRMAHRDSVTLETAYRFDAEGLLSLGAAHRLPVQKGAVAARWFAHEGWAVVVFDGLDLALAGPLCLGTAVIDPTSGFISAVTYAPTLGEACDDAGAGSVPLAGPSVGIRTCGGGVAFITTIPSELGGPLVANVLAFAGDGTGIGLSGRIESPGPLVEIDPSIVDCGALPPAREPRPAVPTPEPTPAPTLAAPSRGSTPHEDRVAPPTIAPSDTCARADRSGLQDVLATPAGPYLVSHPIEPTADTATVIFLPGGGGSYGSAQRVWQTIFSSGDGFEDFRVVIPYSVDGDIIGEARRTYDILEEVLWCHGGDPSRVHLGGTSNGGLAAFGLMVGQPTRFATLAGAPGAFPVQDPASVEPEVWVEVLAGRAILNGVGAFDREWQPEVAATHNALAAAGIESVYVEFPGQGHVASPGFDSSILLDFWLSHG